ncbi:MAG TPA: carboxypeptidase-like regulatory domain-containing protein, partial [Bryobacteraceae bacterium]|nr:carboxypeptidase-like regulatory domain-containing protein [Bryobacteraceae bacterium]
MPASPIRLFLFFALCASYCWGQAGRGEITGEVRDPDGLTVSGARVTATETRTNLPFSTVTSTAGGYTLTSVPPGRYLLSVEAQGFR